MLENGNNLCLPIGVEAATSDHPQGRGCKAAVLATLVPATKVTDPVSIVVPHPCSWDCSARHTLSLPCRCGQDSTQGARHVSSPQFCQMSFSLRLTLSTLLSLSSNSGAQPLSHLTIEILIINPNYFNPPHRLPFCLRRNFL